MAKKKNEIIQDEVVEEVVQEPVIQEKPKKKNIVYGDYLPDRHDPLYVKHNNFKEGLTSEEVETRIDNLQVNIVGRIESKFKKTLKMILGVFAKNTFTFFNIMYTIIVFLLLTAQRFNEELIVSGYYEKNGITNIPQFAVTDYIFLVIVITNLVIGIVQETKSKLAINKLKLVTNPTVTIIRNGKKENLTETDVVLDDIIYVTPGMQVVSDAILLEGEIEVNEAQLTGESVPVKKKIGDMLYSGSFVISGTGYTRVEHVAKENEINKLTSQAKKYVAPKSQILLSLRKLLVVIAFFIVITSFFMFFRNWDWKYFLANGLKFDDYSKYGYIISIKPTSAAMIGMIPAGLYLLTSVALSVGQLSLAKKNTLVQDIYCIEMLARVNVLCLDKTGTITNGNMSVVKYEEINTNHHFTVEEIVSSMNAALQETNATANALTRFFGSKEILRPTEVIPFSSERKYSAVSFGGVDNFIIGAPEFVLKSNYEKYASLISEYANQGLRVICLAQSNNAFKDGKIQRLPKLIALILIEDQIRPEAPDTIQYFKDNGVEVKVISGDNPITVAEVARRVGIENAEKCISLDGMTDEEIIEAATKFTVFGRVKPEQKKLLVQALQKTGKTVAMTGDGVNDIPALKEADCSIAMASGNDAIKSVAQLVLVDSNFASMPEVVKEGRRVINNVQQTAMLYLVKTLFMTALAILTAAGFFIVFGPEGDGTFPLAGAKQLLIVELFAIGIPSFVLAVQANDAPVKGNFLRNALKRSIPSAAGIVVAILLTYIFSKDYGFRSSEIKTIVSLTATFTILIVMCRACIPFNKKKIALCIGMWILSASIILLSINEVNINLFGYVFKARELFEFYGLSWEVIREDAVVVNSTATWLTFSMVVVSFSLMLLVELLIQNIELRNERLANKAKEAEKKKGPVIRRIKY